MKYRYALIAALYGLFSILCASAYAQQTAKAAALVRPPTPIVESVCATEAATEQQAQAWPWYADTVYLVHYYDSLRTVLDGNTQARTQQNGIEDVWLRIPVQFWVYTDNGLAGPGNVRLPGPVDFQNMLDAVNNAFRQNEVKVRFYLLCPRVENDADAVTINNATEQTILALRNKIPGAINIHVCQNVDPLYTPVGDAIFLPRGIYNNATNVNSVPHEVGHYFGLQHTFIFSKTPCFREPVSRGYVWRPFCPQNLYPKTCAVTGDCLTDTKADHEDNGKEVTITTVASSVVCSYEGDRRDFWNDRYRPDVTNLMSYMPRACRRTFSPQQRAVMLNNMFSKRRQDRAQGAWEVKSLFHQFDRYEPDNADVLARRLPEEVSQEHSMQGTGCGADTEDWLSFVVPAGVATASYVLEIADVPNYSNPVATIDIFTTRNDAVTSQIVADAPIAFATISNANGIRRLLLPCGLLNSLTRREILIRLASTNGTLGRYQVTMERNLNTVLGPAKVCPNTNTSYSISGLLPNSIVAWTVSPPSVAIVSPLTGPSTFLQTFRSGQVTLQAVVSENGCDRTLPALSIDVGGPPPPNIQLLDDPSGCGYPIVHYRINDYDPSFTYAITNRVRANGSSVIGSAFWVKSGAGVTTGSFTLTVSNGCGSTSIDIDVDYPLPCEYSAYTYTISPNPTSSAILVEQHQVPSATVKRATLTNSLSNGTSEQISAVQIYDHYGRLRLTQSVQGATIRLALDTLPNGLYVVHILKGQMVVSRQQLKVLR